MLRAAVLLTLSNNVLAFAWYGHLRQMNRALWLVIFVIFATWYLREPLKWSTVVGFAFIAIGATFVFAPWARQDAAPAEETPTIITVSQDAR